MSAMTRDTVGKLCRCGKDWVLTDLKGVEVYRGRARPRCASGEIDEDYPGLLDMVHGLDPEDDSLWTKAGKVRMSVLEAKYGEDLDRHHVRAIIGSFKRGD